MEELACRTEESFFPLPLPCGVMAGGLGEVGGSTGDPLESQ